LIINALNVQIIVSLVMRVNVNNVNKDTFYKMMVSAIKLQ